jgi:hypothetical protein
MTFTPHFLHLLTLSAIEARLSFGEAAIAAPDRRTLAQRAHGEVSRLLAELT